MALFEDFTILTPLEIQIIPYSTMTGHINMSLDHYLANNFHEDSDPIIRFYGWDPYCISIGIHQKEEIINREMLFKSEYDLVRRPTGGRAILHANELTYCAIFPKKKITHKKLYGFLHIIIAKSLNKLGYDVSMNKGNIAMPNIKHNAEDFPCFTRSAETEIQYYGKKVVGSAQRIYKKSILQHGSILIGKEHEQLTEFLNETPERRLVINNELREKTVCLNSIKNTNITSKKIMRTVINELELIKDISVYFKPIDKKTLSEISESDKQHGSK